MNQTTKPTALLLSGGGAKGAFQIGAWKALEEAHLLEDIQMVCGCSVGALNAVLFALGDWKKAKAIWDEIKPSDLLSKGSDGVFFSREGLIRVIDSLPLSQLRFSKIRVIVSIHDIANNQPQFVELNGLPNDEIKTLLLSSSAIPKIFAPEYYHNKQYLDGGVTPEGDLCLTPAYQNGHRNILIVSLRPKLSIYGGSSYGNGNLTQEYPDADFLLIKPLRPMGNLLTGTLNFAPMRIQERIEQGYSDTQKLLSENGGAPQNPEEINALLVQKMKQLFPTGDLLSAFLQIYSDQFAPNISFPTLGGSIWYDNIFEVDGWKMQQHRTPGLQSHYRILNPANVRKAWFLEPSKFLSFLEKYESSRG
ncbi:MAG: patatin-like phospholipase family protein [Oscillospiraceae bacterium]|nr:patatin-like phospholipase family protein [Oscillospiraceae bacterium]